MIVCSCRVLTRTQFEEAVRHCEDAIRTAPTQKAAEARVFKYMHEGCGQNCGSCIPTIREIIQQNYPTEKTAPVEHAAKSCTDCTTCGKCKAFDFMPG